MSTFKGLVPEFPRIRIDYFRKIEGQEPPLAAFLSHVHSDHLLGLDSLKSPFVYCSSATREMLLRLEKFPHRINFTKGITEVVPKTYRHLSRLLKPLPLDTPTRIELSPGKVITVTLLNANHCLGAVSFLIEDERNAVLYTGDIRAEQWLLDSWARSPRLLPYIPAPRGPGLRRLSTIYLDTTFMISSHVYAQCSPKAQGLSELYTALQRYPRDTVFYMHAWTFGYEEVLSALSGYLDSPVHLDRYRYGIYTSVGSLKAGNLKPKEAAALCGFEFANTRQPGILTMDKTVRLHSCEKGSGCPVVDGPLDRPVVRIKPIVGRVDNKDLEEVGLGGGQGDLDQLHELDLRDPNAVQSLRASIVKQIEESARRNKTLILLDSTLKSGKTQVTLPPDLLSAHLNTDEDLKISQIVNVLARAADSGTTIEEAAPSTPTHSIQSPNDGSPLPLEIRFPYSRHSSYAEVHNLVELFQPHNVFPCVAPDAAAFAEDSSMEFFFGDACLGQGFHAPLRGPATFTWDGEMRAERASLVARGELVEKLGEAHGVETQAVNEEQDTAMDDDETQDSAEAPEIVSPRPVKVIVAPQQEVVDLRSASPELSAASEYHSAQAMDGSDENSARIARQRAAFEAAQAGEWYKIKLSCTSSSNPNRSV